MFQIHSPKNKGKTKINWNKKLTTEMTSIYISFGQIIIRNHYVAFSLNS